MYVWPFMCGSVMNCHSSRVDCILFNFCLINRREIFVWYKLISVTNISFSGSEMRFSVVLQSIHPWLHVFGLKGPPLSGFQITAMS